MAKIALNGISIAYDDIGGGDIALVLVHGHPFNRSMWKPQIDAASHAGYRVIASDLRGYGETSVVPGKMTLDIFARDIATLLDHLEVGAIVLGGLSMGGQIAMEFCRLYPQRVRGLLLAATFPQAETEEGQRSRHATADRLLREGMATYAREILPKMMAPCSIATLPSIADQVLAMMQATHPAGAAAALRGRAERPSYAQTLAGLDIPALVVVGDEDAFTTRADANSMHALLRKSELVRMEGIGHMPNLERSDEFNAAMLGLLQRVAKVPA